jgi:hypothetical protein
LVHISPGWVRCDRSDYYGVRTTAVFEDLAAVHFWRLAMLRAELIRIVRFILKLLRVQTLVI